MSEPPSLWLLLAAAPLNLSNLPGLNLSDVWCAVGALLLLVVCAYFIAALTAFSATHTTSVRAPGRAAGVVQRLSDRALSRVGLRLGQALGALAFAVLAAPLVYRLLLHLFGARLTDVALSLAVTLLFLAALYTAVAECAKVLAEADPERTLRRLAPSLLVWRALSYPLALLVLSVSKPVWRRLGAVDATSSGDGRHLLGEDPRASDLDENEQKLLSNVFDFSEMVAHEMMVPRPDVVWISTGHSLEQVLERVIESGHTRFPLCEGSPDKVIGYLHAKDLAFLRGNSSPARVDLRGLVRPVAFVPETARAITLLRRFQEERSHLAVVVDEFGGMAGVLALEDLLEELVGDIRDEFDVEEAEVQALDSGELSVDGGMRLEELSETLGLDFGEAEEETIGGYIFGSLARVVRPGDQVRLVGVTLHVEDVDGLRVTRVRLIPEVKPVEETTQAVLTSPAALHAASRGEVSESN